MADYPVRPAPVIVRGRAIASQVAGIDAELTTQTAHLAAIETAVEQNSYDTSGHLGDTGELDHHFNGGGAEDLTLQPGEWLTLAAKSTAGTPSHVTGSINTREDH